MIHLISFLITLIFSCEILTADQTVEQSAFTKGYFISKLEEKFPNEKIDIDIQDHTIIVYAFPASSCENIQRYLQHFPAYQVVFDSSYTPSEFNHFYPQMIEETQPSPQMTKQEVEILEDEEDWLPEFSPFFPTMLAQPHIIGYSAGYRTYDKTFRLRVLPVSIGDQFSLYQFKTSFHGQLYIGIEACVWAIFEARAKSLSLINADYHVGIPLTYFYDNFTVRLRIYHESSHLGDEFLLEHPRIERLNPSMEVADLSLAYEFNNQLTTFIGYSRVLRSDESYKIKPNLIYYGFNYFLNFFQIRVCNLEATPYIATYFSNYEDYGWRLNSSGAIGYQWDKLYGHKFRIFIEGHHGYSAEGQFSKQRTSYAALKIFYGY